MVEFLSTCPTNWGKEPLEAMDWLKEKMIPQYPLGVFKGEEIDFKKLEADIKAAKEGENA
jgi:2-oxoglutarate ferredoxin oxidoreductase subunit beta